MKLKRSIWYLSLLALLLNGSIFAIQLSQNTSPAPIQVEANVKPIDFPVKYGKGGSYGAYVMGPTYGSSTTNLTQLSTNLETLNVWSVNKDFQLLAGSSYGLLGVELINASLLKYELKMLVNDHLIPIWQFSDLFDINAGEIGDEFYVSVISVKSHYIPSITILKINSKDTALLDVGEDLDALIPYEVFNDLKVMQPIRKIVEGEEIIRFSFFSSTSNTFYNLDFSPAKQKTVNSWIKSDISSIDISYNYYSVIRKVDEDLFIFNTFTPGVFRLYSEGGTLLQEIDLGGRLTFMTQNEEVVFSPFDRSHGIILTAWLDFPDPASTPSPYLMDLTADLPITKLSYNETNGVPSALFVSGDSIVISSFLAHDDLTFSYNLVSYSVVSEINAFSNFPFSAAYIGLNSLIGMAIVILYFISRKRASAKNELYPDVK